MKKVTKLWEVVGARAFGLTAIRTAVSNPLCNANIEENVRLRLCKVMICLSGVARNVSVLAVLYSIIFKIVIWNGLIVCHHERIGHICIISYS